MRNKLGFAFLFFSWNFGISKQVIFCSTLRLSVMLWILFHLIGHWTLFPHGNNFWIPYFIICFGVYKRLSVRLKFLLHEIVSLLSKSIFSGKKTNHKIKNCFLFLFDSWKLFGSFRVIWNEKLSRSWSFVISWFSTREMSFHDSLLVKCRCVVTYRR